MDVEGRACCGRLGAGGAGDGEGVLPDDGGICRGECQRRAATAWVGIPKGGDARRKARDGECDAAGEAVLRTDVEKGRGGTALANINGSGVGDGEGRRMDAQGGGRGGVQVAGGAGDGESAGADRRGAGGGQRKGTAACGGIRSERGGHTGREASHREVHIAREAIQIGNGDVIVSRGTLADVQGVSALECKARPVDAERKGKRNRECAGGAGECYRGGARGGGAAGDEGEDAGCGGRIGVQARRDAAGKTRDGKVHGPGETVLRGDSESRCGGLALIEDYGVGVGGKCECGRMDRDGNRGLRLEVSGGPGEGDRRGAGRGCAGGREREDACAFGGIGGPGSGDAAGQRRGNGKGDGPGESTGVGHGEGGGRGGSLIDVDGGQGGLQPEARDLGTGEVIDEALTVGAAPASDKIVAGNGAEPDWLIGGVVVAAGDVMEVGAGACALREAVEGWIDEADAALGRGAGFHGLLIDESQKACPSRCGEAGAGVVSRTLAHGTGVIVEVAFHGDVGRVAQGGGPGVGGVGDAGLPAGNTYVVRADAAAAARACGVPGGFSAPTAARAGGGEMGAADGGDVGIFLGIEVGVDCGIVSSGVARGGKKALALGGELLEEDVFGRGIVGNPAP